MDRLTQPSLRVAPSGQQPWPPTALMAFGDSVTASHRALNEDAYLCNPEQGLFAVSDGVGGLELGWMASAIALAALSEYYWRMDESSSSFGPPATDEEVGGPPGRCLVEAVHYAHLQVLESSRRLDGTPMGTTIVAARVTETDVCVAHVGDSRCYTLHDGQLRRVTRDHTVKDSVRSQLPTHLLLPDGIPIKVNPNALFQVLGRGPGHNLKPGLVRLDRRSVDALLLVSDGVTGVLSDRRIMEVLTRGLDPIDTILTIQEQVSAAGTPDDATAVLVDLRYAARSVPSQGPA